VKAIHAEAVIDKDGGLRLEHLPFPKGQAVHVIVSSTKTTPSISLKGAVLKYEKPFDPVAVEDWESAK
jgi:hypothetical protein